MTQRLDVHEGKVVVLNFWASWCSPCKKELPLLAKLHREWSERGVVFVGASTDTDADREKAEALLAKSKVDYEIWYGLSPTEMHEVGLGEALPVTAVFDRDGRRAFRIVGEIRRKHLEQRLEWLLGDRSQDPPKELWLPAGIDATPYAD